MGVIGAVTGNVVDLMADLGEAIIVRGFGENPVESIKVWVYFLIKKIKSSN